MMKTKISQALSKYQPSVNCMLTKTTRYKAKVLIISSLGKPPYVGGIENVIDTMVKSDLSKSYKINIFDTYREPDPDRKIYQKLFFAIRLFFLCGYNILKNRPHIVHIHFCSRIDFWKHSICLIVSKILGRRTIFHLHGGSFDTFYQSYSPTKRSAVRLIFKIPNIIIVLSNYWYKFLSGLSPASEIRILPNPINCDKLSSHCKDQLENRERSILLLGSLGKRKGHYDVLKAMPEVLKHYPDAQVYFAGLDEDYGATETLQKLAENYKISNKVNFCGPVSGGAKLKLLGRSSIIILPSYAENMPISVLEGMAAKKPVISTRVGAIAEVLGNGECGILIDPGDWEALSKNIVYLFDDTNYANFIGELAHKKALENWDINKIIMSLDTIYKELLES